MGKLGTKHIEEALHKARKDQRKESIPVDEQKEHPKATHNAFVFFNIQAVDGEGHAILGLGPIGEPIMTYSYYRDGDALKAPARMACLRAPETFEGIEKASGWIVHGNPGNWWNEHVDAALAMSCTLEAYEPMQEYAEAITKTPGTYDFITHNCLNFVEDALRQGGIRLETRSGHPLHKIAPAKAFEDTCGIRGAHKYGNWKYWFKASTPPDNGLRTIPAIGI